MKKIFLAMLAAVTLSAQVHAGCEQAYSDQIKNLNGKMNPPRAVAIGNVGGMVISQAVIYGATGAFSAVAGWVVLPAVAVAAGGYYGTLVVEKARLRTAAHVIRDAKRGKGEALENFMQRLERRNDKELDQQEVIAAILKANDENQFCTANERTDRMKLAHPLKMVKLVEKQMALN